MVTTAAAVTSTMQNRRVTCKYNTTTEHTHLKQPSAVVGAMVNLTMVTNVVLSTTYKQ
jgi:hypothetical protein